MWLPCRTEDVCGEFYINRRVSRRRIHRCKNRSSPPRESQAKQGKRITNIRTISLLCSGFPWRRQTIVTSMNPPPPDASIDVKFSANILRGVGLRLFFHCVCIYRINRDSRSQSVSHAQNSAAGFLWRKYPKTGVRVPVYAGYVCRYMCPRWPQRGTAYPRIHVPDIYGVSLASLKLNGFIHGLIL